MVGYNSLNLNLTAAETISVKSLVKVTGDKIVSVGTDGTKAGVGVAVSNATANNVITVQVDGIAKVVAADVTIAGGELVIPGASGVVKAIASGTFDQVVGKVVKGYVKPIAQVDTLTIGGTFEADDIFTVIVDGTSVVYTAVGGDTNNEGIIDKLVIAVNDNATTGAIVTAVKATASTMTLTADVPGTAFTATSTAVDGGGTDDQTLTRGATTANTAQVGTTTIEVLLM